LLDLLHLALRGQPGGVRLPLRLPGGVEGALERSYFVQEGLLPIAQLHDLRLQLVEIGQRHLLVLDLVVQLALALRAPRAVALVLLALGVELLLRASHGGARLVQLAHGGLLARSLDPQEDGRRAVHRTSSPSRATQSSNSVNSSRPWRR